MESSISISTIPILVGRTAPCGRIIIPVSYTHLILRKLPRISNKQSSSDVSSYMDSDDKVLIKQLNFRDSDGDEMCIRDRQSESTNSTDTENTEAVDGTEN